MDRRAFIGTLAGGLLAAPRAVEAQKAGKVYRVGVLEIVDEASNPANLSAFRKGLGELGYVEGQNLVIEYRSADGRPERFSELATELVGHNVDIIVTRGTPATLTAKLATRTIPIVMASSGDPVFDGTVASLARPGGNVTGLHALAPPELGGRRLQLLKEAVPAASRIGILWNPDLYTPLIVRDTERVARAIGVQLKSLEVKRSEPFEQMFETALFDQIDALIAVEDQLTLTYRARFLEFAGMSRLPAIYGLREFVDAGGLMSYGTDRRDLYRRAASYVHRILAGASPADLPVEPPIKFELAIKQNVDTRVVLAFRVGHAGLERWLHAPWQVDPGATGPSKGANPTVSFIDRLLNQDGEGKVAAEPATRLVALVVPVKHGPTGETALRHPGIQRRPVGSSRSLQDRGFGNDSARGHPARGGSCPRGMERDVGGEGERWTSPRNYPGSCSQREPTRAKATYVRSADFRGFVCGALALVSI